MLLFLGFLIAILPSLLYFVGFFVIIYLISVLAPFLKWIFRILGIILLIAFLGSLVKTCTNKNHHNPIPFEDTSKETNSNNTPIVNNNEVKDYWIKRYREWNDYDGNKYQGYYQLLKSDLNNSTKNKNNLSIGSNRYNAYDEIVFNIKEFDKNKFDKVYPLFDSIGKVNKLDKIQFAQMIVSFVQDIPYVLVLENGCNPSLYNDTFTREYLSNPNAKCDGYQKFGINSPVEFLANLNGDCDTRTLLLYTILAHYDYDVAMMSSEYYGHSIIGINLPLNGVAYTYNNQRYVLWETTIKNAVPGNIPDEISNTNNWRISLKSK